MPSRTIKPHSTEARAARSPDSLRAKPAPKALPIPKESLVQRLEVPADKTLTLLWIKRGHIESILSDHNQPIRRRIRIKQVDGQANSRYRKAGRIGATKIKRMVEFEIDPKRHHS